MAYLNHAGTSWPKPAPVQAAVGAAMAASPEEWDTTFAAQHARVAAEFGVRDASRLLLTPGCTSALALAAWELPWNAGDRVLISAMEHHALARPMLALRQIGVEVEIIPRSSQTAFDLERLESELKRGRVKLVALSAASNVTGELLPFEAAAELAHEHGAHILVDGAQVAGWLPIDVERLGLDLFAFAGHKGLQAPWGLGGLFVAQHVTMVGGSAQCNLPLSGQSNACSDMPGYCDAGSVDRLALAGLAASVHWLGAEARAARLSVARAQIERMALALEGLPGIRLLGSRDPQTRMPTIAFTWGNSSPAEIEAALRKRGVIVAAGLQCAPMAHESLQTQRTGAVRISAGPSTGEDEVERALDAIVELGRAHRRPE